MHSHPNCVSCQLAGRGMHASATHGSTSSTRTSPNPYAEHNELTSAVALRLREQAARDRRDRRSGSIRAVPSFGIRVSPRGRRESLFGSGESSNEDAGSRAIDVIAPARSVRRRVEAGPEAIVIDRQSLASSSPPSPPPVAREQLADITNVPHVFREREMSLIFWPSDIFERTFQRRAYAYERTAGVAH
jgi:hypothetical protein